MKKMIRGKRKCKKCGELGHGESSHKCPLNGTKKRQVLNSFKLLAFDFSVLTVFPQHAGRGSLARIVPSMGECQSP